MPLNCAMQGNAALCSAILCRVDFLKSIKADWALTMSKKEKWPEIIQDGATIVQKYGKQISFRSHI